ncbi:MAG: flagellar biosynthesis protein FlhF [Desulfocapsaceae bacterium]|nr:flagellar biosynthesis protein FlhF [Desulfocapsaceae bacterium]
MQVKIFETTDMASGLKLVKKELGPEALILSTRTVRSGTLGLLGKQVLEITAAVDTPWPGQTEKNMPGQNLTELQTYTRNGGYGRLDSPTEESESPTPPRFKIGSRPAAFSQCFENEPSAKPEQAPMRQELDELKSLVKNLAGEITRLGQRSDTDQNRRSTSSMTGNAVLSQRFQSPPDSQVMEMLLAHGINQETAKTISRFAKDSLNEEDRVDESKLRGFLRNTIADIIEVHHSSFERPDQQHRIALIGPTGVGKTTTLAKIAAFHLSNFSDSIALITIDTYRIAAVEQLKVYGEIMHLPVDVVLTPAQLEQAIQRHQDKKLILIDTAGRSPRDMLSIDELATFLQPDLGITKHLVLSATGREDELLQTIARFSRLGIDNTIFTKVDECVNLGIILNTQIHNSSPISYITNGQRVPEDLFEADKNTIAELIMPNPEGRLHD